MTKNNVQDSAFVFMFNDGNYLSLHEGKTRHTFEITSTFINAEMFQEIHDVPEWITQYLAGTLVKVNLEVTE